jgi:hypothetical protein
VLRDPLARTTHRRLDRARRRRDRVNDHGGRASRDAFHPTRALALRRPFERPARTFFSTRDGATASLRASRAPLRPGRSPCGPLRDWVPVHAPVARRDRASWTSAPLADFC